VKKLFLLIVLLLLVIAGCSKPKQDIIQPEVYSKQQVNNKLDSLDKKWQQSFSMMQEKVEANDSLSKANSEEFKKYRRNITAIRIPDSVSFCNVRIPLEIPDVRQRFEKQMYLIVDDQAQVLLYLLRAKQFFPIIEEMLAQGGISDDIKYIAVIESALKPTARSRAKAQGFWQFMYWTAKKYKVNSTKHVDMRNDLEASTQGAIAYFIKLHKQFDGDWLLALAGYNMGENAETINYWEEIAKDTLTITIRNRLLVRWIADWCTTTYRQIKLLNPEVKGDRWGPGKYVISIPQGTRQMFFNGLEAIKKGEYKP